jgi:hypothetical protein
VKTVGGEETADCRVTRRVNALVLLNDGRNRRAPGRAEDAGLGRDISQPGGRTDVAEPDAGMKLLQQHTATVQDVLQSTAEMTACLIERSADGFKHMWGVVGDEMLRATHQSSDSLNAVVRSNAVISDVTKSMSREWLRFGRERTEQNFNHLKHLLRCRTPQDLSALQSESLRANLESFFRCARLIAETSRHVADEATERSGGPEEQIRAA